MVLGIASAFLEFSKEHVARGIDFSTFSHDYHLTFSTADIDNFVLDFPREVVFAVFRMLDFLESIPDITRTSSKASHVFARITEMEHFAFLGQDHREELSMGNLFDVFAFIWHFYFG